jgi:hypothetical protein
MGYTVGEWQKGMWASGAVVVVGILVAVSGISGAVGGLIVLFGLALCGFCYIGLGSAQKKIQQHQDAARNFEAKVQTDSSKSRW